MEVCSLELWTSEVVLPPCSVVIDEGAAFRHFGCLGTECLAKQNTKCCSLSLQWGGELSVCVYSSFLRTFFIDQ